MDIRSTRSPQAPSADAPRTARVLVWDLPVRVFHWLLVLCFAGAWLTAEDEALRWLHYTLGYTVGGLVGFRLVWGAIGSRYARFIDFVRGPRAVGTYLRGLRTNRPVPYLGHNPAGALAILAMLGLLAALAWTGWLLDRPAPGAALEELHETLAYVALFVVVVHVAAVLASSALHHENLVGAMFSGRKRGTPDQGIPHAWASVGVLLLLAVLAFWWLQWDRAGRPAWAPGADVHVDASHTD